MSCHQLDQLVGPEELFGWGPFAGVVPLHMLMRASEHQRRLR